MAEVDVLIVRVDKVEEEIFELKQDIKEEFKEIKENIKRNEDFYTQNLIYLRENLAELTTITKNHEKQITEMNQPQQPQNENLAWYQEMLTNQNKWVWYVLLILLGTLLGLNASDIAGFIGK